jgi:ubiquinone/menaquinone biosynthesis C-methylase UbiE
MADKTVAFLNPYTVVEDFELKPGMSVADFGSGAGHFAMAMANKVGSNGAVYAVDVRQGMLEVLRGHIHMDGTFQIKTVLGDLEKKGGSTLLDDSQDRVLCSNILHQVDDPAAVIAEARRIVKPTGQFIDIDWTTGAPFGPAKTIPQEEVQRLAQKAGFVLKRTSEAGAYHYGLIFEIKPR